VELCNLSWVVDLRSKCLIGFPCAGVITASSTLSGLMVSRTKPLARKPSSSALAITLVLQVVDGEIGDKVSLIPAATPPNNNGLQLYAMYVYVCVSAVYSWRQAQEADAAVPEEEQKKGADQINMGRELGAGSFELLISATDF